MKLKEIVPEYHSQNTLVRKLFFSRLQASIQLARLKLKSNASLKVVDFGCGEGTLLELIEKEFGQVETFGLDVEPNILELKKILRAKIKIADLRESGFSDSFFDAVFCLDVLEHFQDLEKPVEEIKRILKDDGLLVVSLPTENWFYKFGRLLLKGTASSKSGPASSPHFRNAKEIEKFLDSSGLEKIKRISLPSFPTLFQIISYKKIN